MQAKSPSTTRCQHRTVAGRQCRSLAADVSSKLCPHHAATRALNVREPLTRQAAEFQNAQGVNHSLGALYDLLAEGRISPRRASVLAYISSLLLRTLPAIDYDHDRFREQEAQAPAAANAAAQPVPAGKESLPKTADAFADAALARKPN
jgi:hypothetical protein